MTTTLPASVLEAVDATPVEDLLLSLFRGRFPDLSTQTLVRDEQTFPFLLVRSDGSWGTPSSDERFVDSATVAVEAFCGGINADEDASLLSKAAAKVLREAINQVFPGKGHLMTVETVDKPRRSSDWATSVGPVQYADLPTGVERWEASYRVTIRKPLEKPYI